MKISNKTAWLAASALLIMTRMIYGEAPAFAPKITDVTVFKDGHALALARGTAAFDDGWARTRTAPVPLLGAFWTFVADKEAKIDFVSAGMVETENKRPCMTLDEMIQANTGKRATIVEKEGETTAVSVEGVLRGIPQDKSAKETLISRQTPIRYDRWGRPLSPGEVRETREEQSVALASFVMLETKSGMRLIERKNIRSVVLADSSVETSLSDRKQEREIAFHAMRGGKPLKGEHEAGMIYVQKGVRWIPDYRIELLGEGKALVSLQGTVVNEMADLENVNLNLAVGVPSFAMKGNLSPMSVRETAPQLSAYFRPPEGGGADGDLAGYLSNAVMTQAAMPVRRSPSPADEGPAIPGEGQQEDLYIYNKPGFTLKKGQSAVVPLLEVIVPYEDVYTWDVAPLPPTELWQNVNQDQLRQLMSSLSGAKAMHQIRLTNTGSAPWTVGPATIFKEGAALGQQLMTYTSIKNTVDVPVTVATDVNTKKVEAEASREQNIKINDNQYTKVSLHGKLTATNFKDRPVRLLVTRRVVGKATAATADGRIIQTNAIEDASTWSGGPYDYGWWRWWSWPWWWNAVNSFSEIKWETEIPAGKSATFEYDWHYYHRQ